jgi:hypothetical protein
MFQDRFREGLINVEGIVSCCGWRLVFLVKKQVNLSNLIGLVGDNKEIGWLGGERYVVVNQESSFNSLKMCLLNGWMGRYSRVLKWVCVGNIILSVGKPWLTGFNEWREMLTK